MNSTFPLQGVLAAAVTPLKQDFTPDLDALPGLLDFLAKRGCHGALLLGTTGEGPSFAYNERCQIFQAAQAVRQSHPNFRLLAGTGTPSLEETKALTRAAFEIGMDGVVVLPPYYYRKASDDGLFAWFSDVILSAVPPGGALFGYHIPSISGVALSMDLIARLKETFPDRFKGIKDSSGDVEHGRLLGQRFGRDLVVFTGNDRIFTSALQSQVSGCITAMANLYSPDLRRVWDGFFAGQLDEAAQARLVTYRAVMDRFPPAPPLLKALLHLQHGFPAWTVRPPLMPIADELLIQSQAELNVLV
jgi:4-hydroxy-tetrahydrodipicolinate synthase